MTGRGPAVGTFACFEHQCPHDLKLAVKKRLFSAPVILFCRKQLLYKNRIPLHMQIILSGNLPASIPKKYLFKQGTFSVHINTIYQNEIDSCTVEFYHSQELVPPFQRKYQRDKAQPIRNLLFDLDETDFKLCADMCKVISPVLDEDDEVVIIPLF
jgi:hypothetical protein